MYLCIWTEGQGFAHLRIQTQNKQLFRRRAREGGEETGKWEHGWTAGILDSEMARDNSSFEGGEVLDRTGGLEPGYCDL